VPRELRHTFVSIISDKGVSIEVIADLVGHASTVTTQRVYRKQLKPVIKAGATAMDLILGQLQTGAATPFMAPTAPNKLQVPTT
jgi:integrase